MWCGVFLSTLTILVGVLAVLLLAKVSKIKDLTEEASAAWELLENRTNEHSAARSSFAATEDQQSRLIKEQKAAIDDLNRRLEEQRVKLVAAEGTGWHWKQRADRAETALRLAASTANAELSRLSEALKTEKASA